MVQNVILSFVRIPGSGSEEDSAKPAFCDLARASTLAATVSIPQILPIIHKDDMCIQCAEVQKLKEIELLKKENELLKTQISLFRQLIQNPPKLQSVLRRLDKKAPL